MSRKEERNLKMLRALGQEDLLERENIRGTIVLRNYIKRLAITQFTWKQETPLIDFDVVEEILYMNGSLAFWEENNVLMYGVYTVVNFDFYGIPSAIDVTKSNGKRERINGKENFVILYDNNMKQNPPIYVAEKYCEEIENVDMAMQVNMENLKTPAIVECEESQLVSFSEIFRKIRNNKKTIPVAKGTFDRTNANVLNLNCPNNIPSLMEYREYLMNECLMQFGINCVNIRKKERLTSDEATQNNERINLFKMSRYNPRKRFCDEISEKFNLFIEVEFTLKEGGKENGENDCIISRR